VSIIDRTKMADALSNSDTLVATLETKLLGFDHIK